MLSRLRHHHSMLRLVVHVLSCLRGAAPGLRRLDPFGAVTERLYLRVFDLSGRCGRLQRDRDAVLGGCRARKVEHHVQEDHESRHSLSDMFRETLLCTTTRFRSLSFRQLRPLPLDPKLSGAVSIILPTCATTSARYRVELETGRKETRMRRADQSIASMCGSYLLRGAISSLKTEIPQVVCSLSTRRGW